MISSKEHVRRILDLIGSGDLYYTVEALHEVIFVAEREEDESRAADGIALRDRAGCDIPDGTPCSMLEMMAALALRTAEDFFGWPLSEKAARLIFCSMVHSLRTPEDRDISEAARRYLDGNYGPDGCGGLFYIPFYTGDMRQLEIWRQMQLWLGANYLRIRHGAEGSD